MTPRRTRRRARAVALSALGMLAASTLLGGSAHAQTTEPATLGGYEGSAHASGVHAFYNPEGLLPTAAILDVGAPDALATISSGPVTFARAAVADPGDLLVNPDALLTQADPSYPQGTLPAYPFRISANSTVGAPEAESKPAPGLDARVEATDGGSTSVARTPAIEAPGVIELGTAKSVSTTTFEGDAVQVHARNEISGFSLLGLLEIESIVTDVVATSAGDDTVLEGGTVLTGATFMDQPVIIDEEGIRMDPDAEEPDAPLLGAVKAAAPAEVLQALSDAGLRISMPGPIEQDGEQAGALASTGLRIDLELSERTAPIIGQVADALPPMENPIPGAPGLADAIVFLRATHLSALEVGRAQVSLTTRPAFVAPPFEAGGPSSSPSLGGSGSAPSLSPPIARTPAPAASLTPAPAPAGGGTTPVATSDVAPASLGAGIGALALLALLAQPFLGRRIARAGAAVLATSPTDTCPHLEEP
ncbi:MAG TPA: hypothetical protein VFU14_09865 [Acidimicrobiales bacterium]|nr:hypothetical protein [Acidimicrobiales bacterium]